MSLRWAPVSDSGMPCASGGGALNPLRTFTENGSWLGARRSNFGGSKSRPSPTDRLALPLPSRAFQVVTREGTNAAFSPRCAAVRVHPAHRLLAQCRCDKEWVAGSNGRKTPNQVLPVRCACRCAYRSRYALSGTSRRATTGSGSSSILTRRLPVVRQADNLTILAPAPPALHRAGAVQGNPAWFSRVCVPLAKDATIPL